MKFIQILKNLKWKLFYFDYDLTAEVFKDDDRLGNSPNVRSFARSLQRNDIRYMRLDPNGDILVFRMPNGVLAGTNLNWYVFKEVFIKKVYELEDKYVEQPFALFDVGLNRGYTSLFFSSYDNCKAIFGYEPHPKTYQFALYNQNLNAYRLATKHINCKLFNYGLGKETARLSMQVGTTDGISTIVGFSNAALDKTNKCDTITVDIVDASQELSDRLKEIEHLNLKKILKIDVEGAEYDIFDSLCASGLIDKFDLIIGESHNGLDEMTASKHRFKRVAVSKSQKGLDRIANQLLQYNFKLIHRGKAPNFCEEFIFVNQSWE